MLLALWTLAGCPKATVPLGQTVVEDIRFTGNGPGFFASDSGSVLADAVEQRESHRLLDLPGRLDFGPYRGDIATVDESLLATDPARLETWYAHHGWFDARFLGWTAAPRKRPGPGGVPAVDLIGKIDRGEPSRLDTDPEVVGLDDLSAPIRKSLLRLVELSAKDQFDLDAYTDTLEGLAARLHERGYAYARVSGHVVVRPDLHQVHVRYDVEPGRPCVFGHVAIVGEKDELLARLHDEIAFVEGDGYRTSKLLAARQRLYGLGVYSVVEVDPELKTPDDRAVPIRVRLQRRPSRQVQLGGNARVETDRQQVTVAVDYRDDDALKRLYRWSASAEAGVASTANVADGLDFLPETLATAGPVASVTQDFKVPGLLAGKVALDAAGDVLLGVEPGYREFEAQAEPSVSWTPDHRITVTLGYRAKYHRYYDYIDLASVKTRLNYEVREQYLLSQLEEQTVWDARDDKFAPTRNYYLSATLDEAGGVLGGDMDIFRVQVEARTYKEIRYPDSDLHLVLAGRVGGGVIIPWSGDSAVDVDERLFLGGTEVRGFGDRLLGPYENIDPDGAEGPLPTIAEGVGGNASLYGSFELRQSLPWKLGVAAFVDVGRAWDVPERVDLAGVQWAVGGGLRYTTPIGPIRLDVGVVPDPDPYFTQQANWKGWAFQLGLFEAF